MTSFRPFSISLTFDLISMNPSAVISLPFLHQTTSGRGSAVRVVVRETKSSFLASMSFNGLRRIGLRSSATAGRSYLYFCEVFLEFRKLTDHCKNGLLCLLSKLVVDHNLVLALIFHFDFGNVELELFLQKMDF